MDLKEWKIEKEQSKRVDGGDDGFSDPLYQDAVKFVMEQDRISISMLQRYLRIGFNKAARFIEMMERDGIIGPQEGSKPRAVIKKNKWSRGGMIKKRYCQYARNSTDNFGKGPRSLCGKGL